MTKTIAHRSKYLLMVMALLLTSVFSIFLSPIEVSAASGKGTLRAAHLAPSVGNVDIYVNNTLTLPNVAFGTVSDYLTLNAGRYNIKVFLAGANPTTATPAVNNTILVSKGDTLTFGVLDFAFGTYYKLINDDTTLPSVGNAQIKVVHASPDAGAVDVAIQGGPVLFSHLENTSYSVLLEVPAGSYNLEVRRAGTSQVLYTIPTITLAKGSLYTAFAIGKVSGTPGFSVKLVNDINSSRVRVAHLSPGTPRVDVYVNGAKTLSRVSFGTVSNYLGLRSGTYNIKVFLSSAKGQGTPAIEANVTVAPGKDYTIAALDITSKLTAGVYVDDNSKPAAGKARIKVLHASPDAPAVDIAVQNGGPVLVPNIKFKDASGYLEVPAGSYKLEVRVAGTNTVAYTIPTLDLHTNSVYTAIAEGLLSGTPEFSVELSHDQNY